MEYRSSEIKAGIFILVSIIIFFGFLFIIVGMHAWTDKDIYRTRFSFVGGIEKGSVVRYAGLEVGQVKELAPPDENDSRVEVVLEVKKGTPIRQDSYAYLTTIGIMGSFYVEITTGSPNAPVLPPGSLIPSKDVTAFAQMSENMNEATEELNELLRRMNDLLNDDNRKNISSMISSLNQMTASNTENISKALDGLNNLTANLDKTIQSVNQLLAQNKETIDRSMDNLDEILDQSKVMITRLNSAMEELGTVVDQNSSSYEEIIDNLSSLTRNLEAFTEQIKERPWNLIRKSYPPERKLK